ncbi:MAG: formate C-acetyltransferase [Oscillospiraceae bacterium]|jgi:formate C-acetyltransferase|nr:formate C-acetyltransferase [Oscillospiraceae bacterium]
MNTKQWEGFAGGDWQQHINVRDFIQKNYTPYDGDEDFLKGPTRRTHKIFAAFTELLIQERKNGGVLSVDTAQITSILNHGPGYIDKENEVIVGLQTDAPLRRAVNPFGGIRMARQACEDYGYTLDEQVEKSFKYKTTHNDGVFRVYSDEMKAARHVGLITGLPDAYGRGRIIGDYRRVALYGMNFLIEQKKKDKRELSMHDMDEQNITLCEELSKQLSFMERLVVLANMYGFDITEPAGNAKEAVQWLYFGYLGAIKETNGAAMSIGRISTFLDIYFERDLRLGLIDEADVQEMIDDLVIKLRCVRHLRTNEYNEFFAGDPTWVTMSEAGVGLDGRHMVTKTAFRVLNTLYNLSPAAEPNITVLWSQKLPLPYKNFCARVSIDTDSIQYENDDLMRQSYEDDYSIACCVSAMKTGKQMQYFGARCNLPKLLLMAINGGKDEIHGTQVGPEMQPMAAGRPLDYEELVRRFAFYRDWIARLYVNTLNVIHYMHDKYAYERLQMSLHDTQVERLMAFGISGLSIVADSFSAVKYARVSPVFDERGIAVDFEIEGEFPKYGNDDNRVDSLAQELTDGFIAALRANKTYRNAIHTLSALTITSNVAYGKKTGATPDGRKAHEPFAPGANPMHHRDLNGALASLNSVAKINYCSCRDGVSNTFSITPETLGQTEEGRKANLVHILDGYFSQDAQHLNVNVINRECLMDAMEHPELYPNLTIRVSGYAVNFHLLSREQQLEVVNRTFHETM